MTRTAIAVLTFAAACGGDDGGFPIMPGGGGSGSATLPDAAIDEQGDAGTTITGRVCLINDARTPTSCASSGADGFIVYVDTLQTTTAADGTFSLMRPTGSDLFWTITGAGIETSAMKYSATGTPTIPAISTLLYADMISATQPSIGNTDGAVIARVTRAGTPVSDVLVSASPVPSSGVYYDGATATDWQDIGTGANGVAWIPGMPAGSATLAFDTGAGDPLSTVSGVPVFVDSITFVFHTVP